MAEMIRWGFLGTAGIARKNWAAVRHAGNGILTAVASRKLDKACEFIKECQLSVPFPQIPKAVEGYAAILENPEIDAVYVPLPTGLRKDWVIKAARAGKHVLSEKPSAISAADLEEMIAVCAENRVQFMDGVMFMHSARLEKIGKILKSADELGDLRRFDSAFSFLADEDFSDNIRMSQNLEPAGCLGDLGWYCLRVFLAFQNYAMPQRVRGEILREENGVPTEFRGDLYFGNKVSASFYCSFHAALDSWVKVTGTKGILTVDDFVIPESDSQTRFKITHSLSRNDGCDFKMERAEKIWETAEYAATHSSAQESQMFRHFGEIVKCGKLNPFWPEISLKTQTLVDALIRSARQGGELVTL